jgi:hypothetical protein
MDSIDLLGAAYSRIEGTFAEPWRRRSQTQASIDVLNVRGRRFLRFVLVTLLSCHDRQGSGVCGSVQPPGLTCTAVAFGLLFDRW